MRELPVEDRSHAFGNENDIADSVVAVHQRLPWSLWSPLQEPAKGNRRRTRFECEASKAFFVTFDLGQRCVVARLRQEVELVFDGIDPINLRENFGELGWASRRARGHRRRRVGVVAQ